MEIMNQARGYAYVYGVFNNQQKDSFCSSCNAFINTLSAVRENLAKFEIQYTHDIKNLQGEFVRLFSGAKNGLAQMRMPENPVGQKKAGNCKLPEGVCFTKTSLAILQKI